MSKLPYIVQAVGKQGTFGAARAFNMMFKTNVGRSRTNHQSVIFVRKRHRVSSRITATWWIVLPRLAVWHCAAGQGVSQTRSARAILYFAVVSLSRWRSSILCIPISGKKRLKRGACRCMSGSKRLGRRKQDARARCTGRGLGALQQADD